MYFLIITIVAILAATYYFLKRCIIQPFKFWHDKQVPYLKPVIPIGNFPIFSNQSFVEMVNDIYFQADPKARYIGVYQFLEPVLMIRDPDLLKEIAIKHFDSFTDHRQLVPDDLDALWNAGLASVRGNKWRYMRSSLSPAFTGNKMRFLFAMMDDCARRVAGHIGDRIPPTGTFHGEMEDVFTRFTNDVFATCAFGVNVDSLKDPNNEFYNKAGKAVTFRGLNVFKFFLMNLSPSLMNLFNVKLISDSTVKYFSAMIRETLQQRRKNNILRPDILHFLMEARKAATESIPITDQDIIGQSYLFLVAGFDSVSLLITFTFYELAINPEIQEKLFNEIRENVIDSKLNYNVVTEMKYLDMVISEALRKWSPIPSTDRQATKDFIIKAKNPGEKELVVEKGMSIGVPIASIHLDPKYFPEPEKFKPERFSEANRGSFNNNAYMPFGIGPRFCIGTRFGILETKILVVHLLLNFEIVPIERTLIPMKLAARTINPVPKGGMWLGFKRR